MNKNFHGEYTVDELEEPVEESKNLARKLGMSPVDTNYWVVDYEEMNQLIAYDGFQTRYPHWRWGMQYDRQRKMSRYVGGKSYELVNNDDPAHAFLQESNTLTDQKAVITHVEAHADFFANNQWYELFRSYYDEPSRMLEQNASRIKEIMESPGIDKGEVERWIDNLLCIFDNIDQYRKYTPVESPKVDDEGDLLNLQETLKNLEISDEIREEIFDQEWIDEMEILEKLLSADEGFHEDILAFLGQFGKQYDDDSARAEEMEDWQREVIEILRSEAYYFAPQKMTKVMNEGWAAYWESLMMSREAFAKSDEFVEFAEQHSRILGSPGLNPYKLGLEIWKYVENTANRNEVVRRILSVEGINAGNFRSVVDFSEVEQLLLPSDVLCKVDREKIETMEESVGWDVADENCSEDADLSVYPWKILSYESMARRHYSLVQAGRRTFVENIPQMALDELERYLFDTERYSSVSEAIDDVDYTAGWTRMRDVMGSHNDVTFFEEFLTEEFIEENKYFTYEYNEDTSDYRVASLDGEDIKKKLLLMFTNFGKPTIVVEDGNYDNTGELLLSHRYNGVVLDIPQAEKVLERIFEMWGRRVHLKTIVKKSRDEDGDNWDEKTERGILISCRGPDNFKRVYLQDDEIENIMANEIDYDTKPDAWL